MQRVSVLLDTDIGTDVDDCLTLAMLLQAPEVDLIGVTCSYGDVHLRARMTERILAAHGPASAAIPVHLGASTPWSDVPVYWAGHEGIGILPDGEDDHPYRFSEDETGARFIADAVLARPGEIDILAIGPLTTIAAALELDPRVATAIKRITIMGGLMQPLPDRPELIAEHNLESDPAAAARVFAAGVPITLVPLDVTVTVAIDHDGVETIPAGAFAQVVADQIRRYPPFQERRHILLHDPLAAVALLQPELVTTVAASVTIAADGSSAPDPEGAPVDLVTAADADRVANYVLSLLARPQSVETAR